jgi:hypothetical protein
LSLRPVRRRLARYGQWDGCASNACFISWLPFAKIFGSRIKRRSIRTDGLFLRGHAWQAVVFPDGRAAGYEARPMHDDGNEPWNEGFIYQDGRTYPAKAIKAPWLTQLLERSDDV